MRAKLVVFPILLPAWDRLTHDLSDTQERALFRLICHYAAVGGLPGDDKALASIARLDLRTFRRIQARLALKFPLPGWHWPEIDQLIERRERIAVKRSVAGSAGNWKRWKTRAVRRA